jgi:hypothetical protein
MKRFITLLAVIGMFGFQGCTGPEGPPGLDGQDGLIAEVFELRNVNFSHDISAPNTTGYTIYQTLNPVLYNGDVILIYRLSDITLSGAPVWQQIPRTLFLPQGELDYDFDFSKEDFTIYAGGDYNLTLTPGYIAGQTFRIVIVPGPANVTGKSESKKVNLSDYNAVIKAYNIDDSNVKILN